MFGGKIIIDLKQFLSKVAPRHSKRRLILSLARDAARNPLSLFRRLSAQNFINNRLCRRLRIECNVCGAKGAVHYDFPDVQLRREHGIGLLRETLSCMSCGASMRDRQMALGLLKLMRERLGRTEADLLTLCRSPQSSLKILDTDSFSPINRILRAMPGYVCSQYRPTLPNGALLPDGSMNVDLLDMPFPNASLDIIMTSDVMEHVEKDTQAHEEILRCLAPGGTYLFTAPYDPCLFGTRRLTVPSGLEHSPFLLEHHVHGDPHSASGIIAHRIYGQDFLREMEAMGYEIRFLEIHNPAQGIFGGDLFLASKRS